VKSVNYEADLKTIFLQPPVNFSVMGSYSPPHLVLRHSICFPLDVKTVVSGTRNTCVLKLEIHENSYL
jgi:hypothetical protein